MSSDKSTTRPRHEIKVGDRFGRWTVIGTSEKTAHGSIRWLCRCSCGNEKSVYLKYLIKGTSTSCGCFRKELLTEKNTKHGQNQRGCRSAEYNAWVNIRNRCYNPADKQWHNYGGRCISVCDRWRESFEAFIADMGQKPTTRHQIDRIDNDGNYEPGNCRWATPLQNAQNKRNSVYLEHDGKRLTQSEWSRITGISPASLCERRADGWTDAEVLTTPKTPGIKHR